MFPFFGLKKKWQYKLTVGDKKYLVSSLWLGLIRGGADAAEARVFKAGIGARFHSGGGSVTRAVGIVAQK